jgi:N-methylhydantoinase A
VPTYDRGRLHPAAVVTGPAIVEEKDSTAVIGPGATATVDAVLNLVVTFE